MSNNRDDDLTVRLRNTIEQSFDKSDLRLLCADLSVRYENLAGETLAELGFSLVSYFEKRNQLDELIAYCVKARSNIKWPDRVRKVMIFSHVDGFTKADAQKLATALADFGALGVVASHSNPEPPNAIFIAQNTPIALLRVVIQNLSYKPQFLFLPNWSDNRFGTPSEYCISVGLDGRMALHSRALLDLPIGIQPQLLDELIRDDMTDEQLSQALSHIEQYAEDMMSGKKPIPESDDPHFLGDLLVNPYRR